MTREMEKIKEKQISEVMASIENRVRHAYNQGYEQGLKQGYKQGYDEGKEQCSFGKLRYKQGLNDAWECARKIHSLDMFTYDRIFEGYAQYKYIFDNLTASEAIERINEFEKTKDADGLADWHDIPSDEMTEKQLRSAVKDLRKSVIENLPKTGHWIETAEEYYKAVNEYGGGVNDDTPYFVDDIACSECLSMFSVIDNETERFDCCPHCGARMEV